MRRFFIPKPYKQEMQITGRDAHHIMDVLRMGTGDQLQVVADDGISFVGEITAVSTNTVTVSAKEILRETHEPDFPAAGSGQRREDGVDYTEGCGDWRC